MTAEKTMLKLKDKKGKDYDYNIQKYSLYEINLAFKVFCTLKKRVKKRKRRSLISNWFYIYLTVIFEMSRQLSATPSRSQPKSY